MSQKHVPVDGKTMHGKALSLLECCCEGPEQSERKESEASRVGWLASWLCKVLQPHEAASSFPEELQKLVEEKGYLPEQVFNCDEMGLFWKKMSNHTHSHKSAEQPRGSRSGKTALLWCCVARQQVT